MRVRLVLLPMLAAAGRRHKSSPSLNATAPRPQDQVAGGRPRSFALDFDAFLPNCAYRDAHGAWAPEPGYPKTVPIADIIANWNPDDMAHLPQRVYRTLCRFDAATELDKAVAYRNAEVPFQLFNHAEVDATAARWADEAYLEEKLGRHTQYKCEASHPGGTANYGPNHFMYTSGRSAPGWTSPIENVDLRWADWTARARTVGLNTSAEDRSAQRFYFRFSAMSSRDARSKWIFDELPFFHPSRGESVFLKQPSGQRGIHCRFGMSGMIAEAHWDGSRNMIGQFYGRRRYILVDPAQGCCDMYLLPKDHPSGRHSEVDWSKPATWGKFPRFAGMPSHEVVQEPGDMLYLPTFYLHFINSIDTNYQCNTRSGREGSREDPTYACTPGFEGNVSPRYRRLQKERGGN